MKFITILLCSVCVLLAACSGSNIKTSDAFCTDSNWYDRGFEVGSKGGDARLLDRYLDKCKDAKSRDHLREFQKGFIVGIKQFCTYKNGYEMGLSGEENNNLCPVEFREDFNAGFKRGYVAYKEGKQFVNDLVDGATTDKHTIR